MTSTVRTLSRKYRTESPRALAWSRSTRQQQERAIQAWEMDAPEKDVRTITRGQIIERRNTIAAERGPEAANVWLKAVRGALDYALDLDWIEINPAAQVRRLPPPRPDGYRTWREDEIEAYLRHHQRGPARAALIVMLCTGASRADAVALGRMNIRAGRIEYRRKKLKRQRSPLISVPILPELQAVIDDMPAGQMLFLATAEGLPRSPKGLTGDMARWVRSAGLDAPDEEGRRLCCHGLRKACARRLAEAGATDAEIMAWTGHTTRSMITHYSRQYDRAGAADRALEKLAAGGDGD
jgi:integrase